MAILPGEPGLASFTGAKDDKGGGLYMSYNHELYKTCKAPQSNCHHQQTNTQLFTGQIPFLSSS